MKHDRSSEAEQQHRSGRQLGVEQVGPQGSAPAATGHSYLAGAALRANHHTGEGGGPGGVSSELDARAQSLVATHGPLLALASNQASVPEHALAAVVLAESSLLGLGGAAAERAPLRFEPYAFFERTGRWLVATHRDQNAEYEAFSKARDVDEDAALESVRVGVGQLQGGEAQAAGYESPAAMIEAMHGDEGAQIGGLARLAAVDSDLSAALNAEDWRSVASLRAGEAYGALGYDTALASYAAAYQRAAGHGGDDDGSDDKPKRSKRRS